MMMVMNFAPRRFLLTAFAYPNGGYYNSNSRLGVLLGGLGQQQRSVGRSSQSRVPFVGRISPSSSSSSFRYLTTANYNNYKKQQQSSSSLYQSHLDSTTTTVDDEKATTLVAEEQEKEKSNKEQNENIVSSATATTTTTTTTTTGGSTTTTTTTTTSTSWYKSIAKSSRKAAGAVASVTGFVASAGTSLIGKDRRRQTLQTIQPSVDAFTKFLNTSGIDLELSPTLNYHLPRNIVILSRIQRIILLSLNNNNNNNNRRLDDRRQQAAAAASTTNTAFHLPTRQEALRYMRYATAAYGSNMITAAEMDARGKFDFTSQLWSPVTKTRISQHIHIPEDDIVLLDVEPDIGDINHLRHFTDTFLFQQQEHVLGCSQRFASVGLLQR